MVEGVPNIGLQFQIGTHAKLKRELLPTLVLRRCVFNRHVKHDGFKNDGLATVLNRPAKYTYPQDAFCSGRYTRKTQPASQFQDYGNKISYHAALSVFLAKPRRISDMRCSPGALPRPRPKWLIRASILVLALGSSAILFANTPSELQEPNVGTCYCHCSMSSAHASCVKLCDSPKYKARTWLPRCAKPRLRFPAENKDAGPRFPRPGRSERAERSDPASNLQQN